MKKTETVKKLISLMKKNGYKVIDKTRKTGGWGNRLGFAMFLEEENIFVIKDVFGGAREYTGINVLWLKDFVSEFRLMESIQEILR